MEDRCDSRQRATEAEQGGNQAKMTDGRIGEQTFEILLEHREIGAKQKGDDAGSPTSQNHSCVPARTGQNRTSRNTPAFTIVAEWR